MASEISSQPAYVQNTLAMTGDNFYNENCGQQYAAMEMGLSLFQDIELGSNVTIADYGCSQGGNSMPPLLSLTSRLPPSAVASIFFVDLPSNDFTSLIKLLPQLPEGVAFPAIVPKSFYQPVLPPSTVDIGFSLSSINWLQNMPPLMDPNESIQEYLANRVKRNAPAAHNDLIKFLKLRANEFRSGGKLILVCPARFSEDEVVGDKNLRGLPAASMGALMELVKAGKIPSKAVMGFNPPVYERSEGEIFIAFEEMKDMWEVEKFKKEMVPHPAHEKMKLKQQKAVTEEDRINASKEYAGTIIDWFVALFKGFIEKAWMDAGIKQEDIAILFSEYVAMAKEMLWKNGGDAKVEHCFAFIRLTRN